MKYIRIGVYFCIVFAFILSGAVYAGWKKPQSAEPKIKTYELNEWNSFPIMFEAPPGWGEMEYGKIALENMKSSRVLLIDDTSPNLFTFSTRFNYSKVMTWAEYKEAARLWRTKPQIVKNGSDLIISLGAFQGKRQRWKLVNSAFVSLKKLSGKEYVTFRFLDDKITKNNQRDFNDWMSSGFAKPAHYYGYLWARGFASNESNRKTLEEYRKKQEIVKAEKKRKRAEAEKKWKEKQEEKKRKRQAEQEKSRRLRAKWREEMLSGKRPIKHAMDYSILKQASDDSSYQYGPPYEIPVPNRFFDWTADRIQKLGDYYVYWNPISNCGFAFTKVAKVTPGVTKGKLCCPYSRCL